MISIIDPNNRDYDLCHNRAALLHPLQHCLRMLAQGVNIARYDITPRDTKLFLPHIPYRTVTLFVPYFRLYISHYSSSKLSPLIAVISLSSPPLPYSVAAEVELEQWSVSLHVSCGTVHNYVIHRNLGETRVRRRLKRDEGEVRNMPCNAHKPSHFSAATMGVLQHTNAHGQVAKAHSVK